MEYTIKQETALLKTLNGILKPASVRMSETDVLNAENVAVIDPANVCMIEFLSLRAKRISCKFIEEGSEMPKIPTLDVQENIERVKPYFGTSYSTEYLGKIIKIFDASGCSAPLLKVGNDFPLIIEDEDFRIILAPRVSNA